MWPLRDVKHLVSFETTKTECHYTSTNGAHTDAKSRFLSKNSILMKSTSTLNLNFPAKNRFIKNLILYTKNEILPQCRGRPWGEKRAFKVVSHSGWKWLKKVSFDKWTLIFKLNQFEIFPPKTSLENSDERFLFIFNYCICHTIPKWRNLFSLKYFFFLRLFFVRISCLAAA